MALSGVIDRMDRIPGGGYEIIDYKTNRRLPPQSRVDQDLQLSVYHLAAKEIWGIEPEKPHALLPAPRPADDHGAHPGGRRRARRRIADGRRADRRRQVRTRANPLCDWCDFQARCPLFRHRFEKAGATPRPT